MQEEILTIVQSINMAELVLRTPKGQEFKPCFLGNIGEVGRAVLFVAHTGSKEDHGKKVEGLFFRHGLTGCELTFYKLPINDEEKIKTCVGRFVAMIGGIPNDQLLKDEMSLIQEYGTINEEVLRPILEKAEAIEDKIVEHISEKRKKRFGKSLAEVKTKLTGIKKAYATEIPLWTKQQAIA